MPRSKVQLKRIENVSQRQVTYCKRKNGLLKKAYEISTLSDIDLAVIMFSPTGRLNYFCSRKRIEDVFGRYLQLPANERNEQIRDTQFVFRTLARLRNEPDLTPLFRNHSAHDHLSSKNITEIELLQREICKLEHEISMKERRLRFFEPNTSKMSSLDEMEAYEKFVMDAIAHYDQRLATMQMKEHNTLTPLEKQFNNWVLASPQPDAYLYAGSYTFNDISMNHHTQGMIGDSSSHATEDQIPFMQQNDHLPSTTNPFFNAMNLFPNWTQKTSSSQHIMHIKDQGTQGDGIKPEPK